MQGKHEYRILLHNLFIYENQDKQGQWFWPPPVLAETDRFRSILPNT